jgi:hypothetical protein
MLQTRALYENQEGNDPLSASQSPRQRGHGTSASPKKKNVLVPLHDFPNPGFLYVKTSAGAALSRKCTRSMIQRPPDFCLHQDSSDSTPKIAHTRQTENRLRHGANRSRQRVCRCFLTHGLTILQSPGQAWLWRVILLLV